MGCAIYRIIYHIFQFSERVLEFTFVKSISYIARTDVRNLLKKKGRLCCNLELFLRFSLFRKNALLCVNILDDFFHK